MRHHRGPAGYVTEHAGLEPALRGLWSLVQGDAAKVTDEPKLVIRALEPSELILVDVPMAFEAVGIWQGRI